MDRESLQDIAIQVLIANRGASMQDIATAAGIGRTTLHRYFASRDELLRALTLAALHDANQATSASRLEEGTALEALERAITINIPIGHRFHFLLNEWRFDNEEEVRAKNVQQLEVYEALMCRGQQEGTLRSDLPAKWMVNVLTALVFMACESIRDGYTAPRDAPRLVLTTLLVGIGQQ